MRKRNLKPIQIIKAVVFCAAGALVLVFHDAIMENDGALVGIIVGSTVILYGLVTTIRSFIEKRFFGDDYLLFGALSQFMIAAALFAVANSIESVCIVWAVWSILRECREMSKAIFSLTHRRPGVINILESVVIIVFSFFMIIEPGEHHASLHVYLLGVELILEIVFSAINLFFDRFAEKRKERTDQNQDQTNR